MVQSNSWFPIAAASIPKAFSAAIAGLPKLKLETGVPCISSPASSRIVVQKHPRARLSSHGLSAAAPPTGRPADQGHTCGSSAPWKSLIASTRSNVLSGRGTTTADGVNVCRRAARASAGPRDQLGERSEEHTSELQSLAYLVCRLLLEKKKAAEHNRRKTVRHFCGVRRSRRP